MKRLYALVLILVSLVTAPAFAQRAVIIQLPSGQLVGIAYTTTGQIVLTDVTLIKLSDPTPPPPVTVGKRRIVIIQESSEETSAISDLYVLLRKPMGEVNKYLQSKGHLLDIRDPMNVKKSWLDALTAKGKTSGMVIADFDSSAVLDVVDFPTSPADFLAKLKAHGG